MEQVLEEIRALRQEVEEMRESLPRLMYDKNEVSERLGISTRTIDRMVQRGDLDPVRIGGRPFFPAAEIRALQNR